MAAQCLNSFKIKSTNSLPVGIVQLGQTSKLIQTYLACKNLKQQKPGIKLCLISQKEYSKPIQFLLDEIFEQIVYFQPDFLSHESIKTNHSFVEQKFDLIYNLSFCPKSIALMPKIPAQVRVGPFEDNKKEVVVTDSWSQLLYSYLIDQKACPFNLTDIYMNILGVKRDNSIFKSWHSKILASGSCNSSFTKILIHPFEPSHTQTWSLEKWVELATHLLRSNPNCEIDFFAFQSEKTQLEEMISLINQNPLSPEDQERVRAIPCSLSLQQVFNKLGRYKLFIGYNSTLSHLCSLHQLPSVLLEKQAQHKNESHPFNNNSLILSSRRNRLGDISPLLIAQLITMPLFQSRHHLQSLLYKEDYIFLRNHVDIHKVMVNHHSLNCYLRRIDLEDDSLNDVSSALLRIVWAFFLKNENENIFSSSLSEQVKDELAKELFVIEQVQQLYQYGKQKLNELIIETNEKTPRLTKTKKLLQRLAETDSLLKQGSSHHLLARTLVRYFIVQKSNLKTNSLSQMASSSYFLFEKFELMCKTISELLGQLNIKASSTSHDIFPNQRVMNIPREKENI